MNSRTRWVLISFLAGALLCLNDRFQPLRLKSLYIEGFSQELEIALRDWGDTFMSFHPAWLAAKSDLLELEMNYPLTIDTSWNPLRGTLKLTAVPLVPLMKLEWQHGEYLVTPDSKAWSTELWSLSVSADVPDVPSLKVGSSFPLLAEDGRTGPVKLRVSLEWLWNLYNLVDSQPGLEVKNLELSRRAGEDVINCVFIQSATKAKITFIGNVSGLEKSLAAVRELINTHTKGNISLDATYDDKIILKQLQPGSS